MAVGLNKNEIDDLGEPEFVAVEPFPLPPADAAIRFEYPNRTPDERILDPISASFLEFYGDTFGEINEIIPNAIMAGDNFFSMQLLLQKYAGQFRLIYLDPPYCTGFEFQSRTRKKAYSDQLSPAAYIEFMRRRFVLMRELLASDGSLYVHIGHQMVAQLKIVLDEVFGNKAFKNLIVRKKCSSKNYTRKQYPNLNDYILFYTKSDDFVWNRPGEKPEKKWIDKEYPKVNSKGRYKLVPVHAPGTRRGETGKEWRGKLPPPGKHWQFTPEKLEAFDACGEIHWSRNMNPRRKVYLTDDKMIPYTDYWHSFRDAHHQSIRITGYPTEKNLSMMKMIVGASSNPGDLILDPFCGSGTTLHAANDLGRKWIGMDQSMLALESTTQRLHVGLEPMGDFVTAKRRAPNIDMFDEGSNLSSLIDFRVYSEKCFADQHNWAQIKTGGD